MDYFDLSDFSFTQQADVINVGLTIFNPRGSRVNTLRGRDQLIGVSRLSGDFGFSAFLDVEVTNFDSITTSLDFLSQIDVVAKGIDNEGFIDTDRGRDTVSGETRAVISANTTTVSRALAVAETLDAGVITDVFASLDIQAIAEGIDNSDGVIKTGRGGDTATGSSDGSISSEAIAVVDASAVVEAIVEQPITEGLEAFALAIATSLTNATIMATGINNQRGVLVTNRGRDQIDALARSNSSTFAGTSSRAFATAPPENQAIALTVAEAVAEATDIAFGIDNRQGFIGTGRAQDIINATAEASSEAIAIYNSGGLISTGIQSDKIIAKATGPRSYGIFGGRVELGRGNDQVISDTFGGGVKVNAGRGNDLIQGFGDAKLDGGLGFDTLNLEAYLKDDFQINSGANNSVDLSLNGITLSTKNFEQFVFANNATYTSAQLLLT